MKYGHIDALGDSSGCGGCVGCLSVVAFIVLVAVFAYFVPQLSWPLIIGGVLALALLLAVLCVAVYLIATNVPPEEVTAGGGSDFDSDLWRDLWTSIKRWRRSEETAPSPVVDGGVADDVTCSVFAPHLAAPGDEIMVQVFAHLPGQEEEVKGLAEEADRATRRGGIQPLSESVARGERLGFHLQMRGVEVNAPDQEYEWRGRTLAAQFGLFFPLDSEPRSALGTVIVTKGGVPIGHVKFTVEVVTREEKRSAAEASELLGTLSRYREAFISYASQDREKVMPRVQALAAARINIFQDILSLDPGDRWAKQLYKRIDGCDAFFLFWSRAAKDSEWVRREALYAYERQKGREDAPPEIIPIIIEGPPAPQPPEELSFLQFNDKYLYLIKGVEAEAEARRTERK